MQLPGYAMADALGRSHLGVRMGASILFSACGLLLLLLALGPRLGVNLSAAAFLGKMCAAGSFQLVSLLPNEDFPAAIRSTALGACSTVARIAIILVPSLAGAMPVQTASLIFATLALMASGTVIIH